MIMIWLPYGPNGGALVRFRNRKVTEEYEQHKSMWQETDPGLNVFNVGVSNVRYKMFSVPAWPSI